jgi:DNA-binding response OmpR family regulator
MSESLLQKTHTIRPAANGAARGSKLRVIIVDDDPIFRSLAAARFLHSAGEIVEAEDGSVGWYRISTETFHLAVVDLDMPNMGGMDLIRCIRGYPRTAGLPIVVVTSRSPEKSMRETLECGATSFICKPVDWTLFSNHTKGLLNLYPESVRGMAAD